jgi:hypothetical protein
VYSLRVGAPVGATGGGGGGGSIAELEVVSTTAGSVGTAAPSGANLGWDPATGALFYVNGTGNWQAVPSPTELEVVSTAAASIGSVAPSGANVGWNPTNGALFYVDGGGLWQAVPGSVSPVAAIASVALAVGDAINLWNNSGVLSARKADRSTPLDAHGFASNVAAIGVTVNVVDLGTIAGFTGLTIGAGYWLGLAGAIVLEAGRTIIAGELDQYVGVAVSTTGLRVRVDAPIEIGGP